MKLSTKSRDQFHPSLNATGPRTPRVAAPSRVRGVTRQAVFRSALVALGLLGGLATELRAQEQMAVPAIVNYQGRLESLVTNKVYIDGIYTIEFRIWDSPANTTGGLLWAEGYSVYVKGGNFNLMLGDGGSPLNAPIAPKYRNLRDAFRVVPGATDRYLGITVKQDENRNAISGVECTPRQQMLTAPFAFQAQYAQYAPSAGTNLFLAANGLLVSSGTFTASGPAQFNSGLTVAGSAASLKNGLQVSGPTALSGGVDVSGQSTLRGTVGLNCATTNGGFVPVGAILMYSGPLPPPSGWALCDGSTNNGIVSPDLRDRFVVGSGSAYSPKDTGGANNVTLTVSNLPPHSHTYKDGFIAENSGKKHTGYPGGSYDNSGSQHIGSGSTDDDNDRIYNRPMTTDSTGNATAFDIRPKYYALAFIIRVQ